MLSVHFTLRTLVLRGIFMYCHLFIYSVWSRLFLVCWRKNATQTRTQTHIHSLNQPSTHTRIARPQILGLFPFLFSTHWILIMMFKKTRNFVWIQARIPTQDYSVVRRVRYHLTTTKCTTYIHTHRRETYVHTGGKDCWPLFPVSLLGEERVQYQIIYTKLHTASQGNRTLYLLTMKQVH